MTGAFGGEAIRDAPVVAGCRGDLRGDRAARGSPGARAATYKWVDEKGVVHYTDKMPPEAVNKGNVELNKQGVPIKKTDPAPTRGAAPREGAEAERQKASAKERTNSRRRDRALLSTYTSESEIDLARNRALSTIEQQSSRRRPTASSSTSARPSSRRRRRPLSRQAVPGRIERELEGINTEISRQDDLIAPKQNETVAVNALRRRQEALARADRAQGAEAVGRAEAGPVRRLLRRARATRARAPKK